MLVIKRNELNNIVVSVSLNKTLPSPYYLFSFENITSKDKVRFYPKNISTNTDRYDEFTFSEGVTNLSLNPPRVHFLYPGQYYYGVYEMVNSGTTNPQYAISKVGEGRALVIDEADPIPYPFVYESSNEQNQNYVYYQEGVNDARALIGFKYNDAGSLSSYYQFSGKYPRFSITNTLTNHSDYYRPTLTGTAVCEIDGAYPQVFTDVITEEIIIGSTNSIRIELDADEVIPLGYNYRDGNFYTAATYTNFVSSGIPLLPYRATGTFENTNGTITSSSQLFSSGYTTNPKTIGFNLIGNTQVDYGISDVFYTGNTISEVCDNIGTGLTKTIYYTYPKDDFGSGISWFTSGGTGSTWACSLTQCELTPVSDITYIGRFSGSTKVIAEVINGGTEFIFDSICIPVTPTPTPTQTMTPTPSITPTITPTNTITPSITPTQTITPSVSVSPTPTPSITPTITPSPSQAGFSPIVASGGTETTYTDGGITYKVHTFTGGTTNFDVISTGTTGEIDYLLVAGGGGGGGSTSTNLGGGGGGGAGGLLTGTTTLSSTIYSIVVGAGGLGVSNSSIGNNGQDTTAFGLTAFGGGGGSSSLNRHGANGGSGGGAGARTNTTWTGGTAVSGQGFNGATPIVSGFRPSGGGGGGAFEAGKVGQILDNLSYSGGDGGNGLLININGTPTHYAGGGGGAIWQDYCSGGRCLSGGTGGLGGGGNAVEIVGSAEQTPAQDGQANTGGGGGGGANFSKGGDGGSGIVIIKYPLNI